MTTECNVRSLSNQLYYASGFRNTSLLHKSVQSIKYYWVPVPIMQLILYTICSPGFYFVETHSADEARSNTWVDILIDSWSSGWRAAKCNALTETNRLSELSQVSGGGCRGGQVVAFDKHLPQITPCLEGWDVTLWFQKKLDTQNFVWHFLTFRLSKKKKN